MLQDLLNKEVRITYVLGYSYGSKSGVVTKVEDGFVTINNNTLINTDMIVKVIIKD